MGNAVKQHREFRIQYDLRYKKRNYGSDFCTNGHELRNERSGITLEFRHKIRAFLNNWGIFDVQEKAES